MPQRTIDAETQAVILVITVSFLVRTVLVAPIGFSFDETYDTVVARTFALSYYDHPPAIMWLIWTMAHLSGGENNLIVRLPTLLMFSIQNWFLYRLTADFFGRLAGLFAVIAISLSPQFLYIGMFAVTDGPLIFALTGAALFAARAIFPQNGVQSWRYWGLAGCFFGIALLSKFSAILVAFGLLLFFLRGSRHRMLAAPGPYIAALIALVVFAPVILWSLENGFVSLKFQGGRAAPGTEVWAVRTLQHLALVALVMGPLIWSLQIAGLLRALRAGPSDDRGWFFATLAIVPIASFLLVDLFGVNGMEVTHWPAPGYLFAFPLVGATIVRLQARHPRAVGWAIGGGAAAISIAVLVLITHTWTGWIRIIVPTFREYDPILSDQTDWTTFRTDLEEKGLLDSRQYFVLAGRYEICFKAKFVLKERVPVACLSDNPIFNSLSTDDSMLQGLDAIIITNWWTAPQTLASVRSKFLRIEEMMPLWMETLDRPMVRVELELGHNLQRPIFDNAATLDKIRR